MQFKPGSTFRISSHAFLMLICIVLSTGCVATRVHLPQELTGTPKWTNQNIYPGKITYHDINETPKAWFESKEKGIDTYSDDTTCTDRQSWSRFCWAFKQRKDLQKIYSNTAGTSGTNQFSFLCDMDIYVSSGRYIHGLWSMLLFFGTAGLFPSSGAAEWTIHGTLIIVDARSHAEVKRIELPKYFIRFSVNGNNCPFLCFFPTVLLPYALSDSEEKDWVIDIGSPHNGLGGLSDSMMSIRELRNSVVRRIVLREINKIKPSDLTVAKDARPVQDSSGVKESGKTDIKPQAPDDTNRSNSTKDRLKELKELRDQNLIDEETYKNKVKDILKEL